MYQPTRLITSESVTEGHPDKVCDQISDAILDTMLANAGDAAGAVRCAVETLATKGTLVVAGETRAQTPVDVEKIARDTLHRIGYTSDELGIDADSCEIVNLVHGQSPDIAQGVDAADPLDLGAGDQGMVFGYATDETPALMPLPAWLANRMAERLADARKDGAIAHLRPDGKTQVTVLYEGDRPVAIDTVVVSTQHDPQLAVDDKLKQALIEQVIAPVLEETNVAWSDARVLVNPTGRFVVGGPAGDTGLTGRKIIVDTYGGAARHGGGAFSGKDATKVDRSAAYAARWVAKNVVTAGLARRCEVQLAYAIGVAEPVALAIDTFGTGQVSDDAIARAVQEVFDLRPGAIIRDLQLTRPIFGATAAYGHFGRTGNAFTWEKTNRTNQLLQAAHA